MEMLDKYASAKIQRGYFALRMASIVESLQSSSALFVRCLLAASLPKQCFAAHRFYFDAIIGFISHRSICRDIPEHHAEAPRIKLHLPCTHTVHEDGDSTTPMEPGDHARRVAMDLLSIARLDTWRLVKMVTRAILH